MENKKNIAYTHADLKRYHEGKMTPAEMHTLEAAALNDPFLADALEGYANAMNTNTHLTELRTELQNRINREKKRRRFAIAFSAKQLMRAAAVLIFLIAGGWLAFHLPFSDNENIALERAGESKVPVIPPNNITDNTAATSTFLNETPLETKKTTAVAKVAKPQKRKIVTVPKQAPEYKEIAQETFSDQLAGKVSGLQTDTIVPASASAFVQPLSFRGKVVDDKGNPVPFASITSKKAKTVVQSDTNGNFDLRVPDSSLSITVNAAGYQSNQAQLTQITQNQVVLNRSSAALEEVVITTAQPRRNAAAKIQVQEGQLEPKGGWIRYNDYLEESLNEPENLKERPTTGEVSLSFDVDKEGDPINIKVEKSLCESCDQKAIKLLKEGPKWKPRKGKRGTIIIRF